MKRMKRRQWLMPVEKELREEGRGDGRKTDDGAVGYVQPVGRKRRKGLTMHSLLIILTSCLLLNGLVQTAKNSRIQHELAPITKDVRPKPMVSSFNLFGLYTLFPNLLWGCKRF